jgi:hypothetical protein
VRGHVQSECHNTGAYVIDSGVNGPANTISCGCYTGRGRLIPNPRVRVNFGMLQALALTTPHQNQYHENLAELLHSTLLHEFRHVLQYYAGCNVAGSHGQGICSDCNDPKEMDAYLAEIEAGYRPAIYRHAWVRVFVNWDYLAPTQQAVFSARQTAARRKINTAFPGVDWAADAEVVRYQGWCQTWDTRVGGNSRGACNDPMAPVGTALSGQPSGRVK